MTTLHMTAEPNNTVPIGVMITLTCHVDNFVVPVISVKWFHNDVNIYGYRPTHKEALDKYRKENPTPGSWRLVLEGSGRLYQERSFYLIKYLNLTLRPQNLILRPRIRSSESTQLC